MLMLEKFDVDFYDRKVNLAHKRVGQHFQGLGLVSPDHRYCFVSIPKNGSCTMWEMLKNWSFVWWKQCPPHTQFLTILRDPTKRWVSAVAEFCRGIPPVPIPMDPAVEDSPDFHNFLSIPLVKKWIFGSVYLDGHCLPQCFFLKDLPIDRVKFFYQESNGIAELCEYLKLETPVVHLNKSDSEKKPVIDWLKYQLETYQELQDRIDMHFACDHMLLAELSKQQQTKR